MTGGTEPVRPVAAGIPLWRRYGEPGQELRPETMAPQPSLSRGFGASVRPVGGFRLPAR